MATEGSEKPRGSDKDMNQRKAWRAGGPGAKGILSGTTELSCWTFPESHPYSSHRTQPTTGAEKMGLP